MLEIQNPLKMKYKLGTSSKIFKDRMYCIWKRMVDRCENKNHHAYARYGGRGIKVCDRWQNLDNFIQDMGRCDDKNYTLDRVNNNLGYFKENCRWATRKQQSRNMSSNRILEFNGESKTLTEWAEIYGIKYRTLHMRLKCQWSVEEALTTPVEYQNHSRKGK